MSDQIKRKNRMTIRSLVTALVTLLLLGVSVPVASAIEFDDLGAATTDITGAATRQAGAHPDVRFRFSVPLDPDSDPGGAGTGLRPYEMIHRLKVDLPLGLVGDTTVMPRCAEEDLTKLSNGGVPGCPTATQVGVADVFGVGFPYPVYNLEPPAGTAAMFGFNAFGVVAKLQAKVRPGDFGVVIDTGTISQAQGAFSGADMTLWGVPADPIHDQYRYDENPFFPSYPAPAQGKRAAFLTTSTSCPGKPEVTTARMDGWASVGNFIMQSFSSDLNGVPFVSTGCERLPFAPSIDILPTSRVADAPTGLNVDLTVPQSDAPDALATAHVKDVSVTLPAGTSISPSAAAGLEACTDAQIGLDSDLIEQCPRASQIGTVSVETPLLEESLNGAVYVGSQKSDDPQSGQMFRVFITATSKISGVRLKLEGAVRADPVTGQLSTTFANNPQLPFSVLHLKLDGGPNGVLATSAACGDQRTATTISSWSGKSVDLTSPSTVACRAGLGGFAPSLAAGVSSPVAGASSPFALTLGKPDGHTPLAGLTMTLPTGLLAQLKGNLNTQVGTVKAFAGPGSTPFMLPGKVFLEGPYGDAPFSLRVVVPAKAGPFDLGEVTVRQKIYVDPIDAHVTVVSDPIPTIVKGVPVRLQRLDVNVDKAGFMVNPTSCAATQITGTLASAAGQTAALTNRFQVGDCASLALKPSLGLTLSGKGQTTDGKHPAVSALLTQPLGVANLKKVRVALPLSLALDPDNAESDGLCSFIEGSKPYPLCPASSVVGKATAVSPILNEPLSGPVYFTKNERKEPKSGRSIKTLPKIVIPLVGENGVKLTLTGTSDVVDDQLVTTFDDIPDAPVSSFKLDINGGKKGILVVSGDKADICKSTQIADQQIDGQNGKRANVGISIQTPSCPTKIISKKITAKSVVLKIGGLSAGKVTVTGKGIKKTTRTIAKSTVATITAKRTGKAKPGAFKVKLAKVKQS
jgi:hypothetical protein